jgi:3-oxoacyl-[acyl-carrier protein] reductase
MGVAALTWWTATPGEDGYFGARTDRSCWEQLTSRQPPSSCGRSSPAPREKSWSTGLPLPSSGRSTYFIRRVSRRTKRQSPDLVAYTASKAALTSLTKNLSQSLASEGILVNTVSPGSFLSEGMKAYLRALPSERNIDSESLTDAMRVIREDFGHPAHLGRAGDPAEIGPVIAFLASRANSYMTGADVNVDGGSDFT